MKKTNDETIPAYYSDDDDVVILEYDSHWDIAIPMDEFTDDTWEYLNSKIDLDS